MKTPISINKLFIILVLCVSCKESTTKKTTTYKKSDMSIIADVRDAPKSVSRSVNSIPSVTLSLLNHKDSLRLGKYFNKFEFIPLETIDVSTIGRIDKVLFNGDKVFVLDKKISKAVFVFSKTGKFIYSLSHLGNPTGKLNAPCDIGFLGDQLLVLDNNHLIMKYNRNNGNFIDFIRLPFSTTSFIVPDPSKPLAEFYLPSAREGVGMDFHLIQLNLMTNEVTGKDFPKENYDLKYSSDFNLSRNADGIYLTQALNDTIFKINKDNSITPAIFVDFGGKNIPKRYLEGKALKGGLFGWMSTKDIAFNIEHFVMTKECTFFTYYYKKKSFFVVRNNITKAVHESDNFIDDKFLGGFNFTPVGQFKDRFVFTVDPNALKSNLKIISHDFIPQTESIYRRIYESAFKVDEMSHQNSNPVLVLAKPIID
jgi:hypothetical protein